MEGRPSTFGGRFREGAGASGGRGDARARDDATRGSRRRDARIETTRREDARGPNAPTARRAGTSGGDDVASEEEGCTHRGQRTRQTHVQRAAAQTRQRDERPRREELVDAGRHRAGARRARGAYCTFTKVSHSPGILTTVTYPIHSRHPSRLAPSRLAPSRPAPSRPAVTHTILLSLRPSALAVASVPAALRAKSDSTRCDGGCPTPVSAGGAHAGAETGADVCRMNPRRLRAVSARLRATRASTRSSSDDDAPSDSESTIPNPEPRTSTTSPRIIARALLDRRDAPPPRISIVSIARIAALKVSRSGGRRADRDARERDANDDDFAECRLRVDGRADRDPPETRGTMSALGSPRGSSASSARGSRAFRDGSRAFRDGSRARDDDRDDHGDDHDSSPGDAVASRSSHAGVAGSRSSRGR